SGRRRTGLCRRHAALARCHRGLAGAGQHTLCRRRHQRRRRGVASPDQTPAATGDSAQQPGPVIVRTGLYRRRAAANRRRTGGRAGAVAPGAAENPRRYSGATEYRAGLSGWVVSAIAVGFRLLTLRRDNAAAVTSRILPHLDAGFRVIAS